MLKLKLDIFIFRREMVEMLMIPTTFRKIHFLYLVKSYELMWIKEKVHWNMEYRKIIHLKTNPVTGEKFGLLE